VSEGVDLPHDRPLGVGRRRHWRGQLPGSYGRKRLGVKIPALTLMMTLHAKRSL